MEIDKVFLTGGTGFVGSNMLAGLIDDEVQVKILVRKNKPSCSTDQFPFEQFQGNILDPDSLKKGMQGCKILINCVGIIIETKAQTFQKMHVNAVKNLVDAAKANEIYKIIHISALGTSNKPVSEYFRTKFEGEEIIKNSGIKFTIIRPSLIFGNGDKFFPVLKKLIKLPLTPVIGKGKNRFQPIFVNDLSKFVKICLWDKNTDNRILEIGGPQIFTFLEMLDLVAEVMNKRCYRIHFPVSLMTVIAAFLEIILRKPPITRDQLRMLNVDNITSKNVAQDFFKLDLMDLRTGLTSYL
jgi:uncharacterized protein YbjT (DUF2867 family)